MSLPETIQWCENHNSQALDGECWFWLTGQVNGPCRIVALSVAGPDDLLIRREDYDAAVERAYRMFRSWLVEDNDAPLRSVVTAALAATEGETP